MGNLPMKEVFDTATESLLQSQTADGRRLVDKDPLIQTDNVFYMFGHCPDIMGDHDHCEAQVLFKLSQQFIQFILGTGIQGDGGLIQQQ